MRTLIIESISGTSYKFIVYPLEDKPVFPDLSGIYMFTNRYLNPQGGYTHDILYIGQTGSFEDRLINSHEKLPCVRKHGFNCVCLCYYDAEESARITSENALIEKWNPICND